ncbi:MAG TPA: hypothetical protein VGN24_00930 [Rhodanobacter sp.]|jgi:hypothetical protein|nr:hypothetical protein [Rhodanobacter sp.]
MKPWLPRGPEWVAPIVGVLALLACLWLAQAAPQQVLLSYLSAFVFFTGLAVGSLALAMVHPLSGGAWGFFIRPQVLAAARTLPLMAVLVLPILLGLHVLYVWSHADVLAHDSLLRKQSWYLNPTFFVIRSVVYFALWLLFAWLFTRGVRNNLRLPRIAAPGLIVFALTTLMATTDWLSSLLPHWHSTTFGMLVATGWMLAAMALATLSTLLATGGDGDSSPPLLQDLGNLLLMFVLGWSYLAFMQYLTIWMADLPAENVWYIPRTLTSWRGLAWFLIAFHFLVPFLVLLSRRAKRNRNWLIGMAVMLLVANLADALWLVVPSFRAAGFALRWTDLLAPLGIGGLWLGMYLGQLRVQRLAPAIAANGSPRHG